MDEPSLFDYAASVAAAVEGADRAYAAAADDWRNHIYETVRTVGRLRPTFTADDVYAWCELRNLPIPQEGRAIGTVFRTMAARGEIVATGQFTNSARVSKHNSPTRIWRLI